MQKLVSATAIILYCLILTSCGAPDDSENGPVRLFNISAKSKNESQPDVIYRVKTKGIGGYLARVFNDKNDVQLSAAQDIGIEPVYSLSDAYNINKPIRKIGTCEDFHLDTLTHSMPYLIPKATELLHDIGKAFNDTLISRSGHKCKLIVTSVLRTESSIHRLKQKNSNATTSSCHMYGTTFDISWRRYQYSDSSYIMYTEDLKNILAEVLYEMRKQGRCYVKYERKQSCFHITAR